MLRLYLHIPFPSQLSELEYWEAVAQMEWVLEEHEPLTTNSLRIILQQILK